MPASPDTYYITTPIYYVNGEPTIGHTYTTIVADVAARFERLRRGTGHDVFFLTGTDEHADKVVTAAAERGLTPLALCDRLSQDFRDAFAWADATHNDFIRTTEKRHTEKVVAYIRRLQKSGDIYLGDYTGWYDPGQEEYVTDSVAKEQNYASAVTGRPLERRTERNYFFRLSAYEKRLLQHVESNPAFIRPDGRRNEVLGRIRAGLQDVPISRAVPEGATSVWGILMPDDPGHRIYVWIDALFNYLSAVDTPDRRRFWPPAVHLLAKDILWFHAVIWPSMLMALGEPLPRSLYVHSYWVAEGRKMSKSLGNYIDMPRLRAYESRFSLDALRWYLLTQGPLGVTDADFSHAKFVDVYNADLANGIGNSTSRVANMIAKYCDGRLPDPGREPPSGLEVASRDAVDRAVAHAASFDLAAALREAIALVARVDAYINDTRPFALAKEPGNGSRLARILHDCAQALRVASLIMAPAMPRKAAELWTRWSCAPADGVGLVDLARWPGPHAIAPGAAIAKGDALFMRADPADPAP